MNRVGGEEEEREGRGGGRRGRGGGGEDCIIVLATPYGGAQHLRIILSRTATVPQKS